MAPLGHVENLQWKNAMALLGQVEESWPPMAPLVHVELTKTLWHFLGQSRESWPSMAPLGHVELRKMQKPLESKIKSKNKNQNQNENKKGNPFLFWFSFLFSFSFSFLFSFSALFLFSFSFLFLFLFLLFFFYFFSFLFLNFTMAPLGHHTCPLANVVIPSVCTSLLSSSLFRPILCLLTVYTLCFLFSNNICSLYIVSPSKRQVLQSSNVRPSATTHCFVPLQRFSSTFFYLSICIHLCP